MTFTVASHPANRWLGWQLNTAEAVLEEACNTQYENCKQVLQSSLKSEELSKISPSGNGFVHAVLDAWAGHFHLRIRFVVHACQSARNYDLTVDAQTRRRVGGNPESAQFLVSCAGRMTLQRPLSTGR